MLSIAETVGTPRALQVAHNALASSAMGRGQVEEGLAHYEQFLAAAILANDRHNQALAHSNLGVQYQFAGEFGPARSHFERAIALRRDLEAEGRNVNTIQRLGWVALGDGDLDKATELGEYARDLAVQSSDRWAADCYDLLGTVCTVRAEWRAAIDYFEQAIRLREHGPHIVGRVETLLGLGTVHQLIGNWSRARQLFAGALDIASSIDPSPWLVAAQRHLGQLRRQLGEMEGLELIRAALALAHTMPRSIEFGPTVLTGVEVGLWEDDPPGTARALECALASGLTATSRVDVLCLLARHTLEAADRLATGRHIESARKIADRLRSPRSHCQVLVATGLAAASENLLNAHDLIERAFEIARTANLVYETERTSAVLAALDQNGGLLPFTVAQASTHMRVT
jgi:tetratricopeptide (TPR) repeat protein